MAENITANQGYQLPHADNKMAFDVQRLIAALIAIDTDMATALAGILGRAPLDSPELIGTPTAPTPVGGDDTNRLATTAYVQAAIAALVNSSPAALDTLNELAAALGNDANFSTTVMTAIAALRSSNAGNARPLYAVAGTIWVSTATAGLHKFYEYDGANDRLLMTVNTATGDVYHVGVGYRLKNIRRITASTTYTPASDIRAVLVRAQGAGGSGGAGGTQNVASASAATGAGAGGFVEKFIADPKPATVTIGAAGAAVTSTGGNGAAGNAGGNTTYNDGTNNLVAGGGPGGNGGFNGSAGFQVFTGATGGTATGGDINIPGEGSENSISAGTSIAAGSAYALGSNGGNSLFGHGGLGGGIRSTSDTRVDGAPGTGFGSGGGAGVRIMNAAGPSTSGAGRPGYVEIWELV